jgi:hypothetical protein
MAVWIIRNNGPNIAKLSWSSLSDTFTWEVCLTPGKAYEQVTTPVSRGLLDAGGIRSILRGRIGS